MEFVGSESASRPVLEWFAGKRAGLARWLARNRFGLTAFLIPVGIRAIPEIIVGPYPVGWDTIASYVPNTLDWASGRLGPLQLLGTAPLMYMITVPVYLVTQVNPVWIFKVMGPVLYGCVILAMFWFLRRGLGWSERFALGGALLTSLYFITLRISWDNYRNMLGMTFLLLALPLLRDTKTSKKLVVPLVLSFLAVSADQLTGILVLSIIGFRALKALTAGRKVESFRLLLAGLPGGSLLLLIVYAFVASSGPSVIVRQPPLPAPGTFLSSLGFLGYAYLPIAPLALLGAKGLGNFDLRVWCSICLGFVLTALLPFFGLIGSLEWSLLLPIPLCTYAAAGLFKLGRVTWAGGLQLHFPQGVIIVSIFVGLILSAGLYIALPAEVAMAYYDIFPSTVPTSMIQDSVPMSDMAGLQVMLGWVEANIATGGVLIAHQAIYGWARAYLPVKDHVLNYGFSSPLMGVDLARQAGYQSVFMIWWANGTGWHSQPNVPSGFVPVAQSGRMVAYAYD